MACRQRRPIHCGCDKCGSTVEGNFSWHSGGESVNGMAEDLCRFCVDSCLFENCAEGNALPLGITDEISANLVRHTCDRHGLYSGRLFNELFIGKRQWCVNHSIDGESPLLRVDFWNNECGVDAVEIVVGCDVRRDAINAVERCSINRCAGGGCWQRLKGLWLTGDCISA